MTYEELKQIIISANEIITGTDAEIVNIEMIKLNAKLIKIKLNAKLIKRIAQQEIIDEVNKRINNANINSINCNGREFPAFTC